MTQNIKITQIEAKTKKKFSQLITERYFSKFLDFLLELYIVLICICTLYVYQHVIGIYIFNFKGEFQSFST